jgi:hypothetical protein
MYFFSLKGAVARVSASGLFMSQPHTDPADIPYFLNIWLSIFVEMLKKVRISGVRDEKILIGHEWCHRQR